MTMKNMKHIIFLAIGGLFTANMLQASSHREAPLIAYDPLADNTDVYAFRSPDDPNSVILIANYIPFQLPHGGPNYYFFGENIRYEIHVDNNTATPGDDIIYRFTFERTNEDPSTFFNIRLGAQNLKNTYTLERSIDGGASFQAILTNGTVPPYNVGERSIEGAAGLNTTYPQLMMDAIHTTSTGEMVFAGPVDDPFFVDLAGAFDLGDLPRQMGTPKDNLACLNVHSIVLKVPISTLQKDGMGVAQASNILDPDFVIGVWASASRRSMRTLNANGTQDYTGPWVQVSRLGMPLTNEAIIPIGKKDLWNTLTPYEDLANIDIFGEHFYNPELALYMDDDLFGGAVPSFMPLRIQRNSLQAFDFGNGQSGLWPLKGSAAVAGTALDDAIFGTLLLPADNSPRSVDLWPIFHTGVPNLAPYQLATGKEGNPLANGKPFINNFLPNGGDMLRLNMAVPVTQRDDPAFSSLGLIAAAVAGLTDPMYNTTTDLEFIPNMDGFPNGRRLEDDVTRIELQAVGGVVLAAIGLWYDDYTAGDVNPVTADLLGVLTYTTGVEMNDVPFQNMFPYEAPPHSGTGGCSGLPIAYDQPAILDPTDLDDDCELEIVVVFGCHADSSGWAAIDGVTGQTNPTSILWSTGETVQFITGLNTGDYSVTVTDGEGCSDTFEFSIDCGSACDLNFTVDFGCLPGSTGWAEIDVVTGATYPIDILWSTGETTDGITNLSSGDYWVMVTDANGCTAKKGFTLLCQEDCEMEIEVKTGCHGEGDGYANVEQVINATNPTSILWSTGANTQFVSGLQDGDYWVMVTDAQGCTAEHSFLIDCSKDVFCEFDVISQGGYGAPPNGNNPGVYLHANFAGAFPMGLQIGCNNTLNLTSAQAVTNFLPSGGQPSMLPQGMMNDPSNYNNALAGQLVAAVLNVGFDAYDPDFGPGEYPLGEASFMSGTFMGWTVQQVIDEANNFIGGCGSNFTASQFVSALAMLNNSGGDSGTLSCTGSTRSLLEAPIGEQIIAYPNPASDMLFISTTFATEAPVTMDLFDVSGRMLMNVASFQVEAGMETITTTDISQLPSGVYLLRVLHGEQLTSRRVIVSK